MSFLEVQTRTAWGRTLAGFAQWCAPQPGWITLDVGSGPGLLPALLTGQGCRSFGCDLDSATLRSRLSSSLVQADACWLPFPSGTFDLLTATNVLFLLPDALTALHEMARLLRPGGVLACLNPSERMSVSTATALADERDLQGLDRRSLLDWAQRAEAHHRWNEAQTVNLFAEAGFSVREMTLKIGPGLARWVKGVKDQDK